MIKLFPSTTIVFWSISVMGIIIGIIAGIIGIFLMSSFERIFFTTLLFGVIWEFTTLILCQKTAAKKFKKITALMTEECRIKDCIAAYCNLFNRNPERNIRTMLLLNLSFAYLHLGDCYTAKQFLDAVSPFPNSMAGSCNKVIYYSHLVSCHRMLHDIRGAVWQMNNLEIALEAPKISKVQRAQGYHNYNDHKFLLNIENGFYSGAEDVFNSRFLREKTQLGKVSSKFVLGKIYAHNGENDKAAEAFAFVKNYGGDSYYAEYAKQCSNFKADIREEYI